MAFDLTSLHAVLDAFIEWTLDFFAALQSIVIYSAGGISYTLYDLLLALIILDFLAGLWFAFRGSTDD